MEYELIFAKRRSVGLKIKNGILTVRAPYGTTRAYIDSIVKKHSKWIEDAIKREGLKRDMYEGLSEDEIRDLKRRARAYFEDKCAYYAPLMGVKYNKLTITSAKTRFGSCNSKGNISFSYRTMLYPEPAREYVAVHELAHLIKMDQSPEFYAIIEKYLPDYKERKRLLKITV